MDQNAIMGGLLQDIVMEKVIRDKLIQAGVKPAKSQNMPKEKEENDEEFDEFDKEAEEIMAKMKEERFREINEIESKKKNKENNWLGEYREIVEEEFLPYVTKNDLAIVHFYHKDFERCKIFDKHLRLIAPNHPEAAFLTLNVEKAPFFVQKLQIKVLPTICFFKKGILSGKTVGFSDLGGNDEFKTIELARILLKSGMIKPKSEEERKGFQLKIGKKGVRDNENDEDSD